ncbi:hypothetical protein GN958_ATG13190, partial [Phytophthora infestans]
LKSKTAMYSADFKWCAVTLHYANAVSYAVVARVLGVSGRSVKMWYISRRLGKEREAWPVYPADIVAYVASYAKDHPCFYVEVLLAEVKRRFPERFETSLLRASFGYSGLSSIFLRRTKKTVPFEVDIYLAKLQCFYSYPEQLFFLDDIPKTG